MMNKCLGPMAVLMALALSGCGSGDVDDLQNWMKEQGDNLRGTVQPLPPFVPYNPVVYDAFDLVDPFSVAKLDVEKRSARPADLEKNHLKEPLEAYDLEKLVMRGTLFTKGTAKVPGRLEAIIEAPDKATYQVKVGSFMGQNFGRVTKISETEIELKETVEDSNGEWVERTTTLPLAEQEQK